MTVPMVLWMAYRGHVAARNIEMAAWTGTIDTGAAFAIQHAAMVPAMVGVMLWRYGEYAQPTRRLPDDPEPPFPTTSTERSRNPR